MYSLVLARSSGWWVFVRRWRGAVLTRDKTEDDEPIRARDQSRSDLDGQTRGADGTRTGNGAIRSLVVTRLDRRASCVSDETCTRSTDNRVRAGAVCPPPRRPRTAPRTHPRPAPLPPLPDVLPYLGP